MNPVAPWAGSPTERKIYVASRQMLPSLSLLPLACLERVPSWQAKRVILECRLSRLDLFCFRRHRRCRRHRLPPPLPSQLRERGQWTAPTECERHTEVVRSCSMCFPGFVGHWTLPTTVMTMPVTATSVTKTTRRKTTMITLWTRRFCRAKRPEHKPMQTC